MFQVFFRGEEGGNLGFSQHEAAFVLQTSELVAGSDNEM